MEQWSHMRNRAGGKGVWEGSTPSARWYAARAVSHVGHGAFRLGRVWVGISSVCVCVCPTSQQLAQNNTLHIK